MSFVSYAQNYEDVRLWRAFRDVEKGRYIDVGGQDPVRDSVSLAFYERGWRGVHVEPTPIYADALRKARPDETVIEAAVTTAAGPISFFEIPTTGLSTGVAEIAEKHGNAGWEYREILVPTVTLSGLFECYGLDLVHWLKIDVEGMEADVLASWGDHPARPAVLIIEATAPLSQTKTDMAWRQMVIERGYSDVVFDGLSRFFVHKDHKDLRNAIAESPNVFDGFFVSDTHFTAAGLVIDKTETVAAVSSDMQSRLDAAEVAAAAEIARLQAEHESSQHHLSETQNALEGASQRLAETEKALDLTLGREASAQASLANAIAKLDALQTEHGQLQREAGYLQGQLEATTKDNSERLAETTARLDRAEKEWHSATAELSSAKNEIARLLSVQYSLVGQLQRAVSLLANAPPPFQRLSSLRGALVRWLMPRKALLEWARHAAEVSRFQSEVLLTAGSMNGGETNSMPPTHPAVPDIASNNGGFTMTESDEPITTVPRLLEPHDRQFIHAAYQSVLGRAPDPEGERYYLARLRSGTHKLVILRQLRRSPEGRAFIPGVAGLDRAIKQHRRANLPLIGWIIRWLTGAEGNSATHRQLRIVLNEMGRVQGDQMMLTREMQHVAERTETLAEWTERLVERIETPPPPEGIVEEQKPKVPRLDQGHMPEIFDSTERRVLGQLRLFAATHGAPA
ncbi:MAG: FkbM family methyltransferase [Erythrobacter sp.]